jgi:hypothetical protein
LQCTNQFYQQREDVTIYAVVLVPGLEYIHIKSPLRKPIQLDVDFDEDMPAIKALSETERRILKPFVKNDTNKEETWFVVLGKFVVPAGEYKTPMELARRVAKEFSMAFHIPRYQNRMQVERVGTGGGFRFTAESKLDTPRKARRVQPASPRPDGIAVDYGGETRLGKYNFLMYTDQLAISAPLGQVLITIDDKETSPIYYIPPVSANTPSFSIVNSLYVYCDVVGHQRVGDSSAQLMDIDPYKAHHAGAYTVYSTHQHTCRWTVTIWTKYV